jgi:DNA polymerase I-like protein with 3'-5' exonuclease and polymerase domains
VHDEIIVECDEALGGEIVPLVREHMCTGMASAFPRVPITVEARVATSW